MILQALVSYYEALAARGEIARPGWIPAKVSYALYLDENGGLEQVGCVKEIPSGAKKAVPQIMQVPAHGKRTSGVEASFLCDNSSYLLGVDGKGKPQRALECFAACRQLHETLLAGVDCPAAHALLAFFQTWDPEKAREHPALAEYLDDILSGGNLVFRFGQTYLHDEPAVRQAWQSHYSAGGAGPEMACLVTGKHAPVAQLHPSIQGVKGAQSSGASLVSFNAPAFCSYNREQGLNAPTSEYAAFAYGAALNHLLADRKSVFHIGDTTVLCWAQNGANAYQAFFSWALSGSDAPAAYSESALRDILRGLCSGETRQFNKEQLDPGMDFFVLGLAPNASRLSVRFFLWNSFGAFLKNVQAHQERLAIIHPGDPFDTIPLWKLLQETVNQDSRDKSPAPHLAGETLRAILNNTRYPANLLNGVVLRIRADHRVNRGRAAILKAYYLKNSHPDITKEVLTVSLNPESNSIPYHLGRLFSVLESIQSAANPGINTTIRDKYFTSASATPGHIFPVLLNLAQKHLKKLDGGLRVYYDKQLAELSEKLGEAFPARLNLPQQGAFQLGYYHQTAARYQ